MKLLIVAILSFMVMLLMKVGSALGFSDSDINTATYTDVDTVPTYRSPGTRQWGQRVANNAAAAYRLGGRSMLVNNELIAASGQLTFDTARDYLNAYIHARGFVGPASVPLPPPFYVKADSDWNISLYGSWEIEMIGQISTTQIGLDAEAPAEGVLSIKAENTGGFTIVNRSTTTPFYVTVLITEQRLVTGA